LATQDDTLPRLFDSRDNDPSDTQIAFTNTCIVSFNSFYYLADRQTVIQVFTLPPDSSSAKNGNRVLCLTHECIVDYFDPTNVKFLKPLVDPVTGATHLRLLDLGRDFQVTCIDLTLPEPCADKVSPMTVEMRHYMLLNESQPISRYEIYNKYIDVSEEGVVRGFYRGIPLCPTRFLEDADHIMKFTIDTRQDEWVIDCGKFSPAEWSHLVDMRLPEAIVFDGMRGKICFRHTTDYKYVVVVGIK
jgi:hypothetical protein